MGFKYSNMFSNYLYIAIFIVLFSPLVKASDNSETILTEEMLYNLGYKTSNQYRYPNKVCETYEKPMILAVKRQRHGIKSSREVKGYKNTYYRFNLVLEEFDTIEKTKKRFKQITLPLNFQTDSWYSKNCSMKKGFTLKNKVYFLATDSRLFSSEISSVLKLLRKDIIKKEKVSNSN